MPGNETNRRHVEAMGAANISSMSGSFRVAIVGSGPAGLSAACRAAETGVSHVLFEAQPHAANTIFRFQKGKHVMAEPSVLPLRSSAGFAPGKREQVIRTW